MLKYILLFIRKGKLMKNNHNLLMKMKNLEKFSGAIKRCVAIAMASMLFATTGFSLDTHPVKAQEVSSSADKIDVPETSKDAFKKYEKISGIGEDTILGADFTYYQQCVNPKNPEWKKTYKDYMSQPLDDIFEYVQEQGINTITLKVAVDPTENDNYLSLNEAMKTLKAVKQSKAKIKTNLVLLYSDSMTYANKQSLPNGWTKEDAVKEAQDYTTEVIAKLKAEDIAPSIITIGNEVNCNFLDIKKEWDSFVGMASIAEIIKKNDIKVALSLSKPENLQWLIEQFGYAKVDYDYLGVNLYPDDETNSYVEACFFEPDNEKSIDGNIVVSREANINGKNICKINGRMVTVNELKEFMSNIIEIHGQNDNQNILNPKNHLKYLDGFIGKELNVFLEQYKNKYEEYLKINEELKANYGDDKERERKLDLLKYQIDEINVAKLKLGEDEELEEKRKVMLNSEKIVESLREADNCLAENCIDALSMAIRAMDKIEGIDKEYEEISNNLKSLYYDMQEVARDVSDKQNSIYFDEEEREYTEERLSLIYSLKRKYGNTIPEILSYKDEIEKEIEHIENLEEYNNKLKYRLKNLTNEMNDLGLKISNIRKKNAEVLTNKINNELIDLEMKNAKINVKVLYNEEEFFKNGKDVVKFYIKTNVGEDEKELIKIASGGEMSRTMLAIKKVLADTDKISVMIFDEIDTGISGKAANRVAQKLQTISNKHQVLCISHLPNIAAVADSNYFISKKVTQNRTNTNIKVLEEEEVIKEIARISSGEINDVTIRYATELRNKKAS